MNSTMSPTDGRMAQYYRWLFVNLDSSLGSHRSAEFLVPMIIDLVRPESVIDVGCGVGSWLVVFQEAGVVDVLGVDGEHLDRQYLRVAPEKVISANLGNRLELPRRFDLALCLEVAGYIRAECAENLIRTLTDAAPVVFFSAPIPFQDNEEIQPNQQWHEYWAQLFAQQDFVPIDCVRKEIWHNNDIAWWYRQNAILYAHKDYVANNERLRLARERNLGLPMRLVHPEHYLLVRSELQKGLLSRALEGLRSQLVQVLPSGVKSAIRKLRAKTSRSA
jgi:SAM-dependent methyltransferase